jgi:hypothetical protein
MSVNHEKERAEALLQVLRETGPRNRHVCVGILRGTELVLSAERAERVLAGLVAEKKIVIRGTKRGSVYGVR